MGGNGLWLKMRSLLPLNFNGSVWHQAVFQYLLHKSLRVFTEPLSLTECFGFMLLTSAEASVECTVSLLWGACQKNWTSSRPRPNWWNSEMFGPGSFTKKVSHYTGPLSISIKSSAKNLGFIFEQHLMFKSELFKAHPVVFLSSKNQYK